MLGKNITIPDAQTMDRGVHINMIKTTLILHYFRQYRNIPNINQNEQYIICVFTMFSSTCCIVCYVVYIIKID